MKQLVVLSGKGGAGKTSVTAAFAHLASVGQEQVNTVLADADVDASNLELVLNPIQIETHDFMGGSIAVIDIDSCQGCGDCERVCRFSAILSPNNGDALVFQVDAMACDGCAACVYACPEQAISMQVQHAGSWFRSQTRFGALFHAQLKPGQENSGKLVSLVKQQARLYALDTSTDLVLVDGPPGIGCPVISAASGADLALIVAEPTLSGIYDMERALQTTTHFRLLSLVVINKADLYQAGADRIYAYCKDHGIEIVGEIPYDEAVTHALVQGEPVTFFQPDAPASQALIHVWNIVKARLAAG